MENKQYGISFEVAIFSQTKLINSFPVHNFFNVKFDNHTPCLYSVQNRNGEQTIWDKF